MVSFLSLAILACMAAPDEPASTDPARSALSKGHFSWYDPSKDSIRPILLRRSDSASSASGERSSGSGNSLRLFGNMISMICFGIGLAVLIGLLVWFWRTYEPTGEEIPTPKRKIGEPSRIESLPEGMDNEFATSNPWDEALRRRNRGDFTGAIICLFAHQLLTLSKLGLVRLAPGRTGRQLVRSVTDPEFRTLVHPTLGLFEVAYYGHRSPTESEFNGLWSQAEAFERRVASGVVQ